MAPTEPMHSYKTTTAQPSVAHEATGLSTAAGNGASCRSPVLLKQRNHVSDSPGIAFGGIELVDVLDRLLEATSTLDAPLTLATLNHWHQRLFAAGPDAGALGYRRARARAL